MPFKIKTQPEILAEMKAHKSYPKACAIWGKELADQILEGQSLILADLWSDVSEMKESLDPLKEPEVDYTPWDENQQVKPKVECSFCKGRADLYCPNCDGERYKRNE